jgi:hypothetical protein
MSGYIGSKAVFLSTTAAVVDGNITVSGSVDGVDIAARDAVLTSTTTTANAALPKSGGTMTGALTVDGAYSYLNGLRISGVDTGNTIYQPTSDLSISSASGSISLKPSGTNILHATNTGVGIGTSSPARNLSISSSGTDSSLLLQNSSTGATASDGVLLQSNSSTAYLWNYESGDMILATNNAERMRIDSSGNLLVGKTATGGNTAGMQIINGSFFSHVRDGGVVQILNRKSSDGDILSFEKDNTTVGSIGTQYGYLGIGTQNTGVYFHPTVPAVVPCDPSSAFVNRDNAIDIGVSNVRFKDAYLSGGVISSKPQGGTAFHAITAGSYIQVDGSSSSAMAFGMTGGNASPATAASTSLGFHHWNNSSWANPVNITRDGIAFNGDTAAANALDDYEEGTWTPTLPNGGTVGTIVKAVYIKVGNLVNAYCNVYLNPTNNSTQFKIGGLPFASTGDNHGGGTLSYVGGMEVRYWSAPLVNSSSEVYFHRHDASTGVVANSAFGGANRQFIMQLTYSLN